jgi:hypothetical protein
MFLLPVTLGGSAVAFRSDRHAVDGLVDQSGNCSITLAKLDASAKAPCTSTTVGDVSVISVSHSKVGRMNNGSRKAALGQPAVEEIHTFRRPRTVTRHGPVAKMACDRGSVGPDIVRRPQVEGAAHCRSVAGAEQWSDVGHEGQWPTMTSRRHNTKTFSQQPLSRSEMDRRRGCPQRFGLTADPRSHHRRRCQSRARPDCCLSPAWSAYPRRWGKRSRHRPRPGPPGPAASSPWALP